MDLTRDRSRMLKLAGLNENVDLIAGKNKEIDARLMKYVQEKEPVGTDWMTLKNQFMKDADPYNLKPAGEVYPIYFSIVDKFLTDNGY
jgi:hypothetical protein